MKKIIFFLLVCFAFSNLKAETINVEGTWLKCITNINSFSCDEQQMEQLMEPMVSSAVNSCIIIEIDKTDEGYIIKNYLTNENYSNVNYQDNEISYNSTETKNDIDYTTNINCELESSTKGECIDNLELTYSSLFTCTSKISSSLLKISLNTTNEFTTTISDIVNILNTGVKGEWKLLGTSFEISDLSIFENVSTVWIWNGKNWSIYSPDPVLKDFIDKYSIPLIKEIPANTGFWVNF